MRNDIEMSAATVDADFDMLFGAGFDADEITGSFAKLGVTHEVVQAPTVALSAHDNGGLDSWGDL